MSLQADARRLVRRLAYWLRFRSQQDELREELAFHREMLANDLEARGLAPDAARVAARRAMGNETYMREEARGVWLSTTLEAALNDVRYAWRGLRRSPVFTAVAVLTLAICIGANTAIFTVMHRVLLAPLPYPEGNRIVRLETPAASDPDWRQMVHADVVRAWAARSRTVEDLAGAWTGTARIGADSSGPLVIVADITPSFLPMLRTPPALGRGFTADDARSGASPVAMISDGLWQARYGGTPDVLGKSVNVGGVQRAIIGVMESHVSVPTAVHTRTDVWLPLNLDSVRYVGDVLGRLRPGVTPASASRELDAIMREVTTDTAWAKSSLALARRAQDLVDRRQKRAIELLFVAVGGLLLIACANIASLLLMRAWTRRRELAVRRALGAGRLRIARQLLTESLTLSVLGGGLGLLIGWAGLRALAAWYPSPADIDFPLRFNSAVLLWTAGVSVATGLLFGVGPALLSTGRSMGDALRIGAQSAVGGSMGRRLRSGLVVAEIALSLIFLVATGLLMRSFVALERTSLGFDPNGLVSVSVELAHQPAQGDRAGVEQALLRTLGGVPGVSAAALGALPWTGVDDGPFAIETPTGPQAVEFQTTEMEFVGSDYFRVARIPLLQGRMFETADELIVNATLARRLWPDGRVIGARFRVGEGAQATWLTVVGIAGDLRAPGKSWEALSLQMYRPTSAAREPVNTVTMRVSGGTAPAFQASLDSAIETGGISGKVGKIVWAESLVDSFLLSRPRFALLLLGLFTAIALALSALGLYGVVAYGVTQRSREIGLRVALGADPRAVARLIVGGSLRLVAFGCGVGIVGAYAATRMLASFLFETSPRDPTSFGAAVLLLTVVALLASFVPMRRAVRIDPMETLRTD